jgi:ubiquinone/menaquinone biosynthesis C-methylase UbiE
MDKNLILNARKPEGELGSKLLNRMNKSHESLAKWGVSHLNINSEDIILDIGCGGGVNIERFLKLAEKGKVYGVDYSQVSIEKSLKLNKTAVDQGRSKIILADVSNLPFDNETFNLVTAFETIYFWPDFIENLKEVNRVLKKDGVFFVCNEASEKSPIASEAPDENVKELLDMKVYTSQSITSSLKQANFKDITTFTKEGSDWLSAISLKK